MYLDEKEGRGWMQGRDEREEKRGMIGGEPYARHARMRSCLRLTDRPDCVCMLSSPWLIGLKLGWVGGVVRSRCV